MSLSFHRLKIWYAGIELRRKGGPIDPAFWKLVQKNGQIHFATKFSAKRFDLVVSAAARRLKLAHDLLKLLSHQCKLLVKIHVPDFYRIIDPISRTKHH